MPYNVVQASQINFNMKGYIMIKVITDFSDPEFRFLSNFAEAPVRLDLVWYKTVEHAYQASKTLYDDERENIAMCRTPGVAKRAGRLVSMRQDWIPEVKIDIMRMLLEQKFAIPYYRDKLVPLRTTYLIEGNWWGDKFWGVCEGRGENHLGKLIMNIADKL